MQERGQRCTGPLGIVVLEYRMQTDNGDFIAIEDPMHAHGLRQTVRNASRTQHAVILAR